MTLMIDLKQLRGDDDAGGYQDAQYVFASAS